MVDLGITSFPTCCVRSIDKALVGGKRISCGKRRHYGGPEPGPRPSVRIELMETGVQSYIPAGSLVSE